MNDSNNYDPFDLPYEIFAARCRAEREVFLPVNRQGATPGTSLYGSFGDALLRAVCPLQPRCRDTPAPDCPSACAARWLFKPYLPILRRNAARPVFLHSPELDSRVPVSAFDIQVTLWGRRAIGLRHAVEKTLVGIGESGLTVNGSKQRFRVVDFADLTRPTPLAHLRQTLSAKAVDRVLVCFETPLRYREKIRADGHCRALWMAGGFAPLPELVGNCAFELAAWDLADREAQWDHDRQTAHCRQIRAAAIDAMNPVAPLSSLLYPAQLGKRFSTSSGRDFPVDGFTGFVELGGDLAAALPWLAALSLAGGGQNRAMGFGRIRIWSGAPLV